MSYCRFSDGDVYLFRHVGGWFDCCGCLLQETAEFKTEQETLDHLDAHRKAGNFVPQYAFDRLREEMAESPTNPP